MTHDDETLFCLDRCGNVLTTRHEIGGGICHQCLGTDEDEEANDAFLRHEWDKLDQQRELEAGPPDGWFDEHPVTLEPDAIPF